MRRLNSSQFVAKGDNGNTDRLVNQEPHILFNSLCHTIPLFYLLWHFLFPFLVNGTLRFFKLPGTEWVLHPFFETENCGLEHWGTDPRHSCFTLGRKQCKTRAAGRTILSPKDRSDILADNADNLPRTHLNNYYYYLYNYCVIIYE